MKFVSIRRSKFRQQGIEGILLILAAAPILFAQITSLSLQRQIWLTSAALVSSLMFIIAAGLIIRKPSAGKLFATSAVITSLASLYPTLVSSPSACLAGFSCLIIAMHFLADFKVQGNFARVGDRLELSLQRAKMAAATLTSLSVAVFLVLRQPVGSSEIALMAAAAISQILTIIWSIGQQSNFHKLFSIVLNSIFMLAAIYLTLNRHAWAGSLLIGLANYLFLPESSEISDSSSSWWEPLLNHPGRVTLVTFLALCLIGTFLLILHGATAKTISTLDAAFTSVSAVCVTGLIVLDTPNDFTFLGQFFIILLIQLGGLGIMTITTVAMHALGHRLSLRQKRLLNSAYNADHHSLADSLILIVKFTAFFELVGAIILTILFASNGFAFGEALWKGIFTAISAFCNAGFALQSDSLIPFQQQPLILHTIAFLIISGGIAPAVALLVPSWLRGKPITVASRLALSATLILLFTGTVFFLAFEWNGSLAGMTSIDKIHNAWFQSVTLRTAGFNSVPLENVLGPTFMMMICLMFIGGSPGGTAGGVKTTTIGVLAATFWSTASGYEDVAMQNRRIPAQTVFKAVTIVASGTMMLILVILMLEATQSINARDLIFEAASALGTVGLTTGATAKLDNIGKIIIMFAMFVGRIGPLTLFTLLSREHYENSENLLEARINLT
jgi:trk system potassium uptake protein TrkH